MRTSKTAYIVNSLRSCDYKSAAYTKVPMKNIYTLKIKFINDKPAHNNNNKKTRKSERRY